MSFPIYITGLGIVSAIGINKQEVLSSLQAKQTGIGKMRNLGSEHTELPVGEVKLSDDQMRQMLSLEEGQAANRTSLMGTIAMREAIAEAGIEDLAKDAFLISGTTVGGMDYTERCFLELIHNDDKLPTLSTHDCGATSLLQARYFGIPQEKVITISTACSSAANAIATGYDLIKSGKAEVVIAGGSEALTKFHLNGFNSLMILDHETCRPFDASRTGLNLGEGAAYVVMESEASVKKRGITPIGECLGYGNACDAYHQTASSPNGEGAYLAMRKAVEMAGVSTSAIQYVNAHGTGTPNNDASESTALKRIFGEHMPLVSSTKSFTGHTTSASGAIESAICLLAINHHFVPANLGWKNQMEDGITPTLGEDKRKLDVVMCNSFGFGGNDTSLIFSAFKGETTSSPRPSLRPVYIRSSIKHAPTDEPINFRDFISPMEARRMGKLQKVAWATSCMALRDAGIETPDGIFMGTRYGMLSNSEKFLRQMCEEGEHALGPTLFMQSTHNTIAGMLASRTKCHGYNLTFSQGDHSLACALRDAALAIAMGYIDNALVGCHDEYTPLFSDMLRRLTGKDMPEGEYSTSMVLTSSPENALEEYTDF